MEVVKGKKKPSKLSIYKLELLVKDSFKMLLDMLAFWQQEFPHKYI